MDGIAAELLGTLGPSAVAGLAVLLVLMGRLIPRSTHDGIVAAQRQVIEAQREHAKLLATQSELLSTQCQLLAAQGQELAAQNRELLEHARVTTAVIQALPAIADRDAS